jgi:hypothetical protein
MSTGRRGGAGGQSTPDVAGTVLPGAGQGSVEHNFTLQGVYDLHRDTGRLLEATNSLKTSIDKLDGKVDKLGEKISGMSHKMYAAGVVLVILVAVGGFIVNKAWDLMATRLVMLPEAKTDAKAGFPQKSAP